MLTVQDILDGTTLWLGLGLRHDNGVEEICGKGYSRIPYSLHKDNLIINPQGVLNASKIEFEECEADLGYFNTIIIFQGKESDFGVCKAISKRNLTRSTIVTFLPETFCFELNYLLDFQNVSERIYKRGIAIVKSNGSKFNIGDYVICNCGYTKLLGTISEIKITKEEIYYNVFGEWVKEPDVTLYLT